MTQKYCDVSNWLRMHKPVRGRENTEAGFKLAEDILAMCRQIGGGMDKTAQVLTALAIVRQYYRKAIGLWCCMDADKLIRRYEDLLDSDAWMTARNDRMLSLVEGYVRGDNMLLPISETFDVYGAVCRCLKNLKLIDEQYEFVNSYEDAVWNVAYFLNRHLRFSTSNQKEYPELLALAWYYANKEFGCPLKDDEYESFVEALRVDVYKLLNRWAKNDVGMEEFYSKI